MKQVVMYKTNDGKLFEKKDKAKEHEFITKFINDAATLILPKKYDTCEFARGSGYIKISPAVKEAFLSCYRRVIEYLHPDYIEMFDTNPTGIIGRYLSDGSSPACRLYNLAAQIDFQNRLWGQPYFANNPSEGKQVQLNAEQELAQKKNEINKRFEELKKLTGDQP